MVDGRRALSTLCCVGSQAGHPPQGSAVECTWFLGAGPILHLGGQATAWEGSPGRSLCLIKMSISIAADASKGAWLIHAAPAWAGRDPHGTRTHKPIKTKNTSVPFRTTEHCLKIATPISAQTAMRVLLVSRGCRVQPWRNAMWLWKSVYVDSGLSLRHILSDSSSSKLFS